MRAIILLRELGVIYLAVHARAQRIRAGQVTEKPTADEKTGVEDDQDAGYKKEITEEAVGENVISAEAGGGAIVSGDPSSGEEPPVPISAILFSGGPGAKECRGTPILNVNLPKPGSQHAAPRCYNVSGHRSLERFWLQPITFHSLSSALTRN